MKVSSIIRTLAVAAVISSLALAASGCKKEEPKVEKAPEQAAPQAGPMTVASAALPNDGFKAELTIVNPPATMKANSVGTVEVKVKNASNVLWAAKGQPDVKFQTGLAYHWLDKNGKMVFPNGIRTDLPSDLEPGKEVTLNAKVKAPEKPGDYILEFDMLQEMVSWFGAKGSPTAKTNVKVE